MRGAKAPACSGHTDTFFPTGMPTKEVLDAARALCSVCPVFDSCREWGMAHFPEIPHGILFGVSALERRLIWAGLVPWDDWRRHSDKLSPATRLGLAERSALQEGVPAVVNAYRIYEVETPEERDIIMREYAEWREGVLAAHPESKLTRVSERLTALSQGATDRGGRALRVPPALRPHCPNGHGQESMGRNNRRRTGGTIWVCWKCRAKVAVEVSNLLDEVWQEGA